ncbi:MAG: DUF1572 domain-containing protein [Saprospiraceae bacterium]|jgi:hypothetical protein|nr:DUF1572 domain-containing protein [Saprospiraceae bacterium]
MKTAYLESAKKQFAYYKSLGEKTFAQIPDDALFWQINPESNSIAMVVHHLWGNMMSRWTDFLTTDGEKEWRDRDAEFENRISSRSELMAHWNEGWDCLFSALNELTEDDLAHVVYIRHEGHTVIEAINRQLAHYPYHIGQIVFIGKLISADKWTSLSIPKGQSQTFNENKFNSSKQ